MKKSIQFSDSDIKKLRQQCCFKNKSVQIKGEDGEPRKYPCIVLYEEETNIPIHYTGLERFICHLAKSKMLNEKTLSVKAYAVCHFLNYILKETEINSIHECTINTLRNYFCSMRTKKDRADYSRSTWLKYKNCVTDFLEMYYIYNKDTLPFQYTSEEIKSIIINDEKVSIQKFTQKKNNFLVQEYMDLLLYIAKRDEPDIALGIALEAYAGLRDGEVVNVTCGRVKTLRGAFNITQGIKIDLTDKAPHFKNWTKKNKSRFNHKV